ncbi:HET-domain-containing protein [Dendrothele bispora CBS 962.96]|uniref:HET-domain-containing protein n=1 Tax=Dendrothele bispora (strain CBS 962.96) TaxID=1314807 RepID=A0A4S8LFR2_DENBC|nr:HET-domain-containing protein [Dendrothele bispora CBS 962.96]
MRLLNTHTYQVEEFLTNIPYYATLSHTWGKDEVTFQDIQNLDVAKTKTGWSKVQKACAYVRKYKFDWIWIDTCCIDKSSSAELSEALNSMYKYYAESRVCIAYLNDLDKGLVEATEMLKRLKSCKWFTRGWTLQELIAPRYMVFLDKDWQRVGTRFTLRHFVSEVTSIPMYLFEGKDPRSMVSKGRQLEDYSIAQKMSWAAKRETTRPEDMAYCLMGLFGVNMPPIYGEGGEKAFMRLQQEIIKYSDDRSIFAWVATKDYERDRGLFASSPSEFVSSGQVDKSDSEDLGDKSSFSFGNNGLRIHLLLHRLPGIQEDIFIASLSCKDDNVPIGISLQKKGHRYIRYCPNFPLSHIKDSESLEDLQEIVVKESVVSRQVERDYVIPIEFELDSELTLLGEVDFHSDDLHSIQSMSFSRDDNFHEIRLRTQKGKEFGVYLYCWPSDVIPTVTARSDGSYSNFELALHDSDLSLIDDENALVSLFVYMTGDSSNQRMIEINYVPSSSPNFKPYLQIDDFECSSHASSLKTLNFTVDLKHVFGYYALEDPTLFPSGLPWIVDDRKTHGSISYSPEQRNVHCVLMYRSITWLLRPRRYIFVALGPYLDQENFYRREPWIDVFVLDHELPISDVWDSYLPSGSRYGRRQDVNSDATVALNDSTSVTATAKKIWDDPVYYYIVLEENNGQMGATVERVVDDAQSGSEGAGGSGGLDEVISSSEYETDEGLVSFSSPSLPSSSFASSLFCCSSTSSSSLNRDKPSSRTNLLPKPSKTSKVQFQDRLPVHCPQLKPFLLGSTAYDIIPCFLNPARLYYSQRKGESERFTLLEDVLGRLTDAEEEEAGWRLDLGLTPAGSGFVPPILSDLTRYLFLFALPILRCKSQSQSYRDRQYFPSPPSFTFYAGDDGDNDGRYGS